MLIYYLNATRYLEVASATSEQEVSIPGLGKVLFASGFSVTESGFVFGSPRITWDLKHHWQNVGALLGTYIRYISNTSALPGDYMRGVIRFIRVIL